MRPLELQLRVATQPGPELYQDIPDTQSMEVCRPTTEELPIVAGVMGTEAPATTAPTADQAGTPRGLIGNVQVLIDKATEQIGAPINWQPIKKLISEVAGGSKPFFTDSPREQEGLINWAEWTEIADLRAGWAET